MRRIFYILTVSLLTGQLSAQDIHFSQFYNDPISINSALTGMFNGDQRAVLNYRNQWSSVAVPFTRYAFAFDTRVLNKSRSNFSMGLGITMFRDKAGDTEFGTTNGGLSLSGIMKLDDHQRLSIGVQGNFEQRAINNSKLIWDSQFDGSTYNAALSSGETKDYNTPFSYGDLNAGLCWMYSSSQKTITSNDHFMGQAGVSFNHITQPKLELGNMTDQLYSRITAHSSLSIGLKNTPYAVIPSAVFQWQGPNRDLSFGSLLRYKLKEESKYTGIFKESAVSLGVHVRAGDAIIPSFNYEIANWKLGFSYDSNISDLNDASNGVGGFEISLIFVNPNPFTYGKGHNARFI